MAGTVLSKLSFKAAYCRCNVIQLEKLDEKTSKTNMTLDKNNKQLKMYDVYLIWPNYNISPT